MARGKMRVVVQPAGPASRRERQLRSFRRYQLFGVLLAAAAILLAALLRTNPRWIFPPGWWRP
jgi:hypothetical protein